MTDNWLTCGVIVGISLLGWALIAAVVAVAWLVFA